MVSQHSSCPEKGRQSPHWRWLSRPQGPKEDGFAFATHWHDNKDNKAGHEFWDGFSRYNQIKMAPEHKTSIFPSGEHFATPFGLKLGQQLIRAITSFTIWCMFSNEVYVDDILVKSKTGEGHPEALPSFRLKDQEVEDEPVWSFVGEVTWFHRQSERDWNRPSQSQGSLLPIIPELRGLIGRLQFLRRFISQQCEPFDKLCRLAWNACPLFIFRVMPGFALEIYPKEKTEDRSFPIRFTRAVSSRRDCQDSWHFQTQQSEIIFQLRHLSDLTQLLD